MSTRVLVTGAEGFIGSHLVEELVKSGKRVRATVLYNFMNSWGWLDELSSEIRNEIEVLVTDIRDPHAMRTAAKDCEVIFHLAALIGIPFSYHSPASYVDTNVTGTLNLLEGARANSVRLFVQTSTSEVYGTAKTVPIDEEHSLCGQSPYAATKIAADQLALSYWRSFNLPVTVIRPFNTYGPKQSLRAVIPTIISQLAKGENLTLGNLTPTRDLTYVEDTVRGFSSCLQPDLKTESIVGQVINLCSEFEISVGEVAETIAKMMDKRINFQQDENRVRPTRSEVERLYGSNGKAKKLLRWEPQYGSVSGFQKGLEKTIPWFLDSKNLSRFKTHLYNV